MIYLYFGNTLHFTCGTMAVRFPSESMDQADYGDLDEESDNQTMSMDPLPQVLPPTHSMQIDAHPTAPASTMNGDGSSNSGAVATSNTTKSTDTTKTTPSVPTQSTDSNPPPPTQGAGECVSKTPPQSPSPNKLIKTKLRRTPAGPPSDRGNVCTLCKPHCGQPAVTGSVD